MTAAVLERRLRGLGYASRMAGAGRVEELRDAIGALIDGGGCAPEVANERLGIFDFRPPQSLPAASSIIVVAIPLPRARLVFHRGGRRVEAAVPPAYLHFDDAGRAMQGILSELLAPSGHRVAPSLLPEKLLAARCGLAAYGRNNITYVRGMGSYHRLAVFFTDLPFENETWGEPEMLPRCANCRACGRACPTAAIAPDRFLLHTERCIVFHNERPGTIPFPGWIAPSSHGCLVGCLKCQEQCPENASLHCRVSDEGEFSNDETALLVDAVPLDRLPPSLVQKLERADLLCLFGVLSRNLRALLQNAE